MYSWSRRGSGGGALQEGSGSNITPPTGWVGMRIYINIPRENARRPHRGSRDRYELGQARESLVLFEEGTRESLVLFEEGTREQCGKGLGWTDIWAYEPTPPPACGMRGRGRGMVQDVARRNCLIYRVGNLCLSHKQCHLFAPPTDLVY
jgi:hypothetical protein